MVLKFGTLEDLEIVCVDPGGIGGRGGRGIGAVTGDDSQAEKE